MVSIIHAWFSWVLGLSSQSSSQHVSWGCSYLSAQLEDCFIQTHVYGCWRILDGYLSKSPAPCHLGLSIGLLATHSIATTCFLQSKDSEREGGRERRDITSKMEVTVFLSLTLKVMFHHFCLLLIFLSKARQH